MLDRLVKLAQLVVDQTNALIALSLNVLVLRFLGNIQTLFEVRESFTEVGCFLVLCGNLHVDSYEVSRDFFDKLNQVGIGVCLFE